MVSQSIGKKIKKLNASGLSQHKIAKKLGISQSTVSDYLKSIGISCDQSATKRAVETKAHYDRERRIALNNMWFEKIESMLIKAADANTLRSLAVSYGIAEDKRAKLDPDNPSGKDTGLEEMREAIHKARHPDDLEASSS